MDVEVKRTSDDDEYGNQRRKQKSLSANLDDDVSGNLCHDGVNFDDRRRSEKVDDDHRRKHSKSPREEIEKERQREKERQKQEIKESPRGELSSREKYVDDNRRCLESPAVPNDFRRRDGLERERYLDDNRRGLESPAVPNDFCRRDGLEKDRYVDDSRRGLESPAVPNDFHRRDGLERNERERQSKYGDSVMHGDQRRDSHRYSEREVNGKHHRSKSPSRTRTDKEVRRNGSKSPGKEVDRIGRLNIVEYFPGESNRDGVGRSSRHQSKDRMRSKSPERDMDVYKSKNNHEMGSRSRDKELRRSRDCNELKQRSSSRERELRRSRDHQEVRRSRSRDSRRSRDRDYGSRYRRSHSRDVSYAGRMRDYEDRRRRSRSGERDSQQSRDHNHGAHYRRSSSRDISRAGRFDDRDDRHTKSSRYMESNQHRDDRKGVALDTNNDEENQEEYLERVNMQLEEQEVDVEKIKEESRKRRQAILEKYNQKKQASENTQQAEPKAGTGLDTTETESGLDQSVIPEQTTSRVEETKVAVPVVQDESDIFEPESTFSIKKEQIENGEVNSEAKEAGGGGLGEGSPKAETSEVVCDDIFGESPAGVRKLGKSDGLLVATSGLHDNWDDAEGYYCFRVGEVLDGRFQIIASHGKGVFSSVVRARNLKATKGESEEVAIKIIRNNDTMYKAGQEELIILRKLAGSDPEDKRHCVRFMSSFKYRNHLCLVFESLHMNLREVLKKFGRNIGLNLSAVRLFAKQLFVALKHLKNCGVLHCDIKPDNMLVNENHNVLKLCDFGNAMFAGKNEVTPYLVSRFYRAPEIILGLPYDHALDIWSVGCCLYELFVGKVLFPGPSNNDMLRLHMELKGPFPKKMLRKGAFTEQHFDHDLNFHASEEDPVTKKMVKRIMVNIKPKDISSLITSSAGEDPKMMVNFKDLLERIFTLDPDKRITVSQALSHPFITGK